MRRIAKFLFSLILLISCSINLCCSNFYWVYAEEQDTRSTSNSIAELYENVLNYDNFAESYFDNLKTNFGENSHGSCGYVAMGMLLSYYDTYWNDNVIPEQYDVASIGNEADMALRGNSPGTRNDIIGNTDEDNEYNKYGVNLSADEYLNIMELRAETHLHSKLITISNTLGYYNQPDRKQYCSSTLTERIDVLNTYLKEVAGMGSDDYSLEYITREYNYNLSYEVREFAINKVKQGIPVLLSVYKLANGDAHAMIAYSYDEETDQLFCHMGWDAIDTHKTPEQMEYDMYGSALAINFGGEHVHSNNYGVTVGEGEDAVTTYYCYYDPTI